MSFEQRLNQGPLPVRSLWTDEQTATLADAVARRQRRQALRHRVALSSLLATGLAAVALLVLINPATLPNPLGPGRRTVSAVSQPPPTDSRAVRAAALGEQVAPLPTEPEEPPLTLTDGTRVTLERGAAFEIFEQSPQSVVCDLASGAATIEVIPNKPRSFTLRAGGVSVAVIGTVFRVERTGELTHVSVERGHVRVSWEAGSQELRAGQAGVFPPVAAPAPKAAAQTWAQLAKAGDYKAAYLAFQSQSPPLQRAEELMLAADSARLSGHAAEAIPHLTRVYRDFPTDARAPLAAFTLGRILADQLGRPGQAAEAFRTARGLNATGPLASDAMAREVECLAQAGNVSQAREVAGRYSKLFPQGRHRIQMQKLAAED